MQSRGTSLGGHWTGVYDYDNEDQEAVPFNASLFDVAGAVWGTSQEPNSFAPGFAEALDAEINGTRSGKEVRFRKTYIGAPPNGEYPVQYAGHVNAKGNRVEGRWVIDTPFGKIGGPFVMDRDGGAPVVRTEAVAAVIEVES